MHKPDFNTAMTMVRGTRCEPEWCAFHRTSRVSDTLQRTQSCTSNAGKLQRPRQIQIQMRVRVLERFQKSKVGRNKDPLNLF